ncbi:Insulinase [compost metagenome]
MEHVEKGQLKNAMTYYICNAETGEDCILYCIVKTGSRTEKNNQSGISHFLEHMCLEFTRDSTFKNRANGLTNYESTLFQFYCKNNEKSINEVLDKIYEIINGEVLNEALMENVRRDVIAEWKIQMISEGYIERNEIYSKLLPKPILDKIPIGQIEKIKKFNFKELCEFHQTHYVPNRIAIICEGNFEKVNIRNILNREMWGHSDATKEELKPNITEDVQPTKRFEIKLKKVPTKKMLILQIIISVYGDSNSTSSYYKNELIKVAALTLLEKAVSQTLNNLGIQVDEAVMYENALTINFGIITLEFVSSNLKKQALEDILLEAIYIGWKSELKNSVMGKLNEEVLKTISKKRNQTNCSRKCINNFVFNEPFCPSNQESLLYQAIQFSQQDISKFIYEIIN